MYHLLFQKQEDPPQASLVQGAAPHSWGGGVQRILRLRYLQVQPQHRAQRPARSTTTGCLTGTPGTCTATGSPVRAPPYEKRPMDIMVHVANFYEDVVAQSMKHHPEHPSTFVMATSIQLGKIVWLKDDGTLPTKEYVNKHKMMAKLNNRKF